MREEGIPVRVQLERDMASGSLTPESAASANHSSNWTNGEGLTEDGVRIVDDSYCL